MQGNADALQNLRRIHVKYEFSWESYESPFLWRLEEKYNGV